MGSYGVILRKTSKDTATLDATLPASQFLIAGAGIIVSLFLVVSFNGFIIARPSEYSIATSGYVLIVPREDVVVLDMEVDEALKMIISLGVVVPTWKKHASGELPFEQPPTPR